MLWSRRSNAPDTNASSAAAHLSSSSRPRTTSGGGLSTFTSAFGLTKTKSRERQHNTGTTSLPTWSLPNLQTVASTDPFAKPPVYVSKDKPEPPVPSLGAFKFPSPSAPRRHGDGSWRNGSTDAPLYLTDPGPPTSLSSSPEGSLSKLSPESGGYSSSPNRVRSTSPSWINLQRAPWLTTPTSGRLLGDSLEDPDTSRFNIAPATREGYTQSISFSESETHCHDDGDDDDDDDDWSDEGLVFHNGLTDSLHYVSANSSRYAASSRQPLPCPTTQRFMAGNVCRGPISNALAAVKIPAPRNLANPSNLKYEESKEEMETKQLHLSRSFHTLKKFPSLHRQLSLPDSIQKPRGRASVFDEGEQEKLLIRPSSPSSVNPSERISSMFSRSRTSSCTSIALDSATLRTVASSKHSRTTSHSDSELEFERSSCFRMSDPTKYHDVGLTQTSVEWRCGGGNPKECCGTRAIMGGIYTGRYECCAERTPGGENLRCCASFVGRLCGHPRVSIMRSPLPTRPGKDQNVSVPAMNTNSQPVQEPRQYVQSITSILPPFPELLGSPRRSNTSGSSTLSIVPDSGLPPPPPYASSCFAPILHTTSNVTTAGFQHRPSRESYEPSPTVQIEPFTPPRDGQMDFLEFGVERGEGGEETGQFHSSHPALQHSQSFADLGSRRSLLPELIQGSRGCPDTSVSNKEEREKFLTPPSSSSSASPLDRISFISAGSQIGLCNSNIPDVIPPRTVDPHVKLKHMRTASYSDSELKFKLSSRSGPTSKPTEHPINLTRATVARCCGTENREKCCGMRAKQEAYTGQHECYAETPSAKDARCCASFLESPCMRSDMSSTSAGSLSELQWPGIPKDVPDLAGGKRNQGLFHLSHASHGDSTGSIPFDDETKSIIQPETCGGMGLRLLTLQVSAVTAPVSGSLESPPRSLVDGQEYGSKPIISPAKLVEHPEETRVLAPPAPGPELYNSPKLEVVRARRPALNPWHHFSPYVVGFIRPLITTLNGPLFRGMLYLLQTVCSHQDTDAIWVSPNKPKDCNASHQNNLLVIIDLVEFGREICKYFQLAISGDERHSAASSSEAHETVKGANTPSSVQLAIEYRRDASFPPIGGPSRELPGACVLTVYGGGEGESGSKWRRQDKTFGPWDIGDRAKRFQSHSLRGSGWAGWSRVRGGGREVWRHPNTPTIIRRDINAMGSPPLCRYRPTLCRPSRRKPPKFKSCLLPSPHFRPFYRIPLPGLQGVKSHSGGFSWEPGGFQGGPLEPHFPGFGGLPNNSGLPNEGGTFWPEQDLGLEVLEGLDLVNDPFQILDAVEPAPNIPTGQFQYHDGGDSVVHQPGYAPPPPVPLSGNTQSSPSSAAWNAGFVAGCEFATHKRGGVIRRPEECGPEWDAGFVAGCTFATRTPAGSPSGEPRQPPDPTGSLAHVAPSMPVPTVPGDGAQSLPTPAGPSNLIAPPLPSHASQDLAAPVVNRQPHDQSSPSSTPTVTHDDIPNGCLSFAS
ncbi:unnamed protein product [Rhizoctonia solani]|uniref:Uncharacterized protein n=1 Tax=Rhizoctonia solani TaxID=456999 RepID=A0A8H3BDP0_9AGAM|nr:unnamed protein product [Rhizoctonia solani]